MPGDDEDKEDALRRIAEDGDDLTQPRNIDFTVVLPDEASAQSFASHFQALGYRVSIKFSQCVPKAPWDVVVVKHMAPSAIAITDFEDELDVAAASLGGRNDGWGCFSIPPPPSKIM